MGKIIEGLWDCPYCEQKGISGLKKHCPNCGHPQDEGTEFYMGTEIKYVAEEKAAQYGKGADWTCGYCDSLNRYDATVCANCGASREETTGDYHENVKAHKAEARRKAAEEQAKRDAERRQEIQDARNRRRPKLILALLAIAAVLVFLLMPRTSGAELIAKDWNRAIYVQENKTVTESDWSIPDGGRLISQSQEIHHYDQVLDHYENVEVRKSRQVLDGYDTETEYVNNGDGTFSEETVQVPRYVTEYYTEIEKRPVYVSVPNKQPWYTYDIERWVDTRSVETSGADDTPAWGDLTLTSSERESYREEEYYMTFTIKKKNYTASVSEDLFNSMKVGDSAKVTVQNGRITQIGDTLIR